MIILDKPYVSDLIKTTIKENNIPVLETSANAFQLDGVNIKTEHAAITEYNNIPFPKIYSNSENAINWIAEHLQQTKLPETINAFKNKLAFRKLIQDFYPDFFFKEIAFSDLNDLDINNIPKPFIIKPTVGFFSMGVYKVDTNADWEITLGKIHTEMEEVKDLYPKEVMDANSFIIEECIDGDEYAFDAYFNEAGEAIIVGIYKHLFSSGDDVSDRVYITSKTIIEDYLAPFTDFLRNISDKIELKNFPLHTEVRINKSGEIIPIEINPMRYGGWCTTADLSTLAYNFNPYLYFFEQKKPNWDTILKDKAGLIYSIVILNNSTGYKIEQIASFNYDKLLSDFHNAIELRKTNWQTYPLFGILFTETPEEKMHELEKILVSDLKEYLIVKPGEKKL